MCVCVPKKQLPNQKTRQREREREREWEWERGREREMGTGKTELCWQHTHTHSEQNTFCVLSAPRRASCERKTSMTHELDGNGSQKGNDLIWQLRGTTSSSDWPTLGIPPPPPPSSSVARALTVSDNDPAETGTRQPALNELLRQQATASTSTEPKQQSVVATATSTSSNLGHDDFLSIPLRMHYEQSKQRLRKKGSNNSGWKLAKKKEIYKNNHYPPQQ